MMKNEIKRILLFSQIPAILFILFYLLCEISLKNEYELFLFGRTCLTTLSELCFLIFLTIEFIAVLLILLKTKKLFLIIINLALLPILFLKLEFFDFKADSLITVKEYSFEQFKTDIVIENTTVLLSGNSTIYQKKNSFILQRIATVSGDDGYCPLDDESKFDITVKNNEITYSYYFDSYANPESTTKELTIMYDNCILKKK